MDDDKETNDTLETYTKDLLSVVGVSLSEKEIKEIRRSGNQERERPLLISCATVNTKKLIFDKAKELKKKE